MKDNSSAQTSDILWTKIDKSEILGLLSGLVKIHKIPHVIETTSQFFLKLRITLQCQER